MPTWIRRHRLLVLFAVVILGLTIFVIADSGCLSDEIPKGTKGSEFLPEDAPYAGYTPVMSQELITWFGTQRNFVQRTFTEKASPSLVKRVLLAPGLETSIDPLFYTTSKAPMYLCNAEISYAMLPDPARPVGEFGYIFVGKLRAAATPIIAAELLLSNVQPGLSWNREGEQRVATLNGTPVLWLWIKSGWMILGDSPKALEAALDRVVSKQPSLATNPEFMAVVANQNTPFGMLSFSNLRSAGAYLAATGKPGNTAFADGLTHLMPGVTAASWGWSPGAIMGKDLNFYPVDRAQIDRLRQRYPKIDLKTATLTNEQTAFYAPMSLPLDALERGDSVEFPLLDGPVRDWMKILGHSSTRPVFSGEGAYLIDLPPDGSAMQAAVFTLKDAAAVRQTLLHLVSDHLPLPQGTLRVAAPADGAVEVFGPDWSAQLQVRDDFLIVTLDHAAMSHFAAKPPGQSILQRPILDNLAKAALDSNGTLVGGIVYDSQMIILRWQDQVLPHWQDFAPLFASIDIDLKEKPQPLKRDQILAGGAFFAFIKDQGVECRHNMDKSHLNITVPISTIPIAANFLYGKANQARYNWFYEHTSPPGGSFQFFVEDFLRSDSPFMPGFAKSAGVMFYDPMFALALAAMNPPLPPSGPPNTTPVPAGKP